MDSLITAAARALAAGDPLGALKRVALRDAPPAPDGPRRRGRAETRRARRGAAEWSDSDTRVRRGHQECSRWPLASLASASRAAEWSDSDTRVRRGHQECSRWPLASLASAS